MGAGSKPKFRLVSRAADQDAGQEYEEAADHDLERRREERRVHEAIACSAPSKRETRRYGEARLKADRTVVEILTDGSEKTICGAY